MSISLLLLLAFHNMHSGVKMNAHYKAVLTLLWKRTVSVTLISIDYQNEAEPSTSTLMALGNTKYH